MDSPVLSFVLAVFLGLLAYAAVRFAPWLPTRQRDIKRALDLADLKSGETFYDLGCGDGRVVIEAAARGAKATGIEVAPIILVAWLRAVLRNKAGARFRWADLFRVPLADADVVYLFGTPRTLQGPLRSKLERELKPGTRVVSYAFAIEGWTAASSDRSEADSLPIHLYLR